MKQLSVGGATRVGGTQGLVAAGYNPGRRPVHCCKVGAVGKIPDARRLSAEIGNEGARDFVAVA